jgi:DUF2892 family protein
MPNFFAQNIDWRGRLARAVFGIALLIASVLLWRPGRWICFVPAVAGGFALYEAVRGWCLMRACGIKTKL